MGARGKSVDQEPAFVLHGYPYRETSLLVDVFTQNYGRVMLVARGARRPRSESRGLLQAFQPLALSWVGGNEIKTLTKAEWQGGMALPKRGALMSAFYLNELLLRFLPREDAHPNLFAAYQTTITALSEPQNGTVDTQSLRRFEMALLSELGYAPVLAHERARHAKNAEEVPPIEPDKKYRYFFERGALPVDEKSLKEAKPIAPETLARSHEIISPEVPIVHGKTLLALSTGVFPDTETQTEARQLMAQVINHHLENRPLHSRQIMRELTKMKRGGFGKT
ncbi:MAG: DNA repair protein RecO [Burkholderiales bacterium]|jgi:DNA repair protein RecO (recombination protein O)|nr:DNA repair protein RecO [Burkholderiales bacterium]